jgi:hypothetical protein
MATDAAHKKGVTMPAPSMPDHPMERAIRCGLEVFCNLLKRSDLYRERTFLVDDVYRQVDAFVPDIRHHYMREVGNVYRMLLDYDVEPAQSNRRTVELSGKGISEQARRNLAKLTKE